MSPIIGSGCDIDLDDLDEEGPPVRGLLMILEVGLPAPWPARVSMRIRTGLSHD